MGQKDFTFDPADGNCSQFSIHKLCSFILRFLRKRKEEKIFPYSMYLVLIISYANYQ
jgi:hypothetical protein